VNDTPDTSSIFAPLWRRKWLILIVGLLVGTGSYFYYKRQRPTYATSTQLYLGAGTEEQAPGEKASARVQHASGTDQAAVITSIVVEQVHNQLRSEHKVALVRGVKVRAKAAEKSEFITISTEAHSAKAAALVANLVAQSYVARQRDSHKRTITQAIAITRRQLRRVELTSAPKVSPSATSPNGAKARSSTPSASSILQATSLNAKINQLEADLTVTGVEQIKPAKAATAELLSPRPRQNAIFGFVLGVILSAILAYVLSRFDRRLRSLNDLGAMLDTQMLTALPTVNRPVVNRDGVPTPSRLLVEPLRRLHAALQVGDGVAPELAGPARVILFVSPDAGDGKSTVVADLALVMRDAGQRVAVVEANFRRPIQARLLGLGPTHGLGDALAGRMPAEAAMQRVLPMPALGMDEAGQAEEQVATEVGTHAGALFLLAGSVDVSNPPALLAHGALRDLLSSLAADFDSVLVDVPSPLEFSDAMPLLGLADGIVVVARIGHTREVAARRLVDLLRRTPGVSVLGFVGNCVARRASERYGFSTPNGRVWPRKPLGR
jgi:Mrp family chromosome partitioning ATPase/capsular polysaccharide biosynthesis protein